MAAIRPNLTRSDLTLDEQSFEGLLSAAFTIQEHNKRRKRDQQMLEPDVASESNVACESNVRSESNVPSEPAPSRTCPHCGAPKLEQGARCGSCGLEEFRPGERLQRNWASMWLKSQELGLWPERPAEADEAIRKIGEDPRQDPPQIAVQRTLRAPTESDPASLLGRGALGHGAVDHGVVDHRMVDHRVVGKSAAEEKWSAETSEIGPPEIPALGMIEKEGSELNLEPVELYADEEFDRREMADASTDAESGTAPASILQRLADMQVKLRFHRADLYLGAAVFVALLALLWPAASATKRAALSPWERALVAMGIAEAPAAPAMHLQGDPSIEVWVDPHTALYYCPGAESYGKTADGRFSSQREAQLDRFEAAGRSVCE